MHIHLKKRNYYAQILNRIKKALTRVSKIETLAYIETPSELYPVQKIKIGQGKSLRLKMTAFLLRILIFPPIGFFQRC